MSFATNSLLGWSLGALKPSNVPIPANPLQRHVGRLVGIGGSSRLQKIERFSTALLP
jgi:hypothetical protein